MIRAFLYWCVEFKNLPGKPAANIKPHKVIEKRAEVYSDEEIEQMLSASDTQEEAILLTLLYTGLREQELCHLAWEDLDMDKKVLRVTAKPEEQFTQIGRAHV